MRILVVCQYFYPEEFKVNELCFRLVKDGHQVTVLTGLPNYPGGAILKGYKSRNKRTEKINGVKVIRSWLIGRGSTLTQLFFNYMSFMLSSSFRALSVDKDFDMILVYQLSPVTMAVPGLILKKMTKKPLVMYCFDLWPDSIASAGGKPNKVLYRIVYLISKAIYRSADAIFISSKMFENYFRSNLKIDKNIRYLPVYAEDIFSNVEYKPLDPNNVNLLFAGNIGEMQSVETIVLAANEIKEHKNIRIHIVGDGSSRNRCERMASELKLDNIIFYGNHPLEDMPDFYQKADAFLVTLKANRIISYTLPGKVQGYMSAGKPILGAIEGETQLIIEEANCGLCALAEDHVKLAENIMRFAAQPQLYESYCRNSKKYYEENFSEEKYYERLKNFLDEVLSLNENVQSLKGK
ncbi:MAG: glycosyltransferase family 4 protein [Eubacteriaceae bacterium]|nr:glycosyltransferase family 4 protein [Eubacteriaceae bacterium]